MAKLSSSPFRNSSGYVMKIRSHFKAFDVKTVKVKVKPKQGVKRKIEWIFGVHFLLES